MKAVQYTGKVLIWGCLIFLSLYFLYDTFYNYLYGRRSPVFGDTFFNNQIFVVLHVLGGSVALLLGPVQFWPLIRKKYTDAHRWMGKIYLAAIGLICFSALRLSLISSCIPCRVSLFLLTILTIIATFFAWKAIKARNIKVHQKMMIRSYIAVLSFIAVRLEGILPLEFLFGTIEDPVFVRVVNEYFFSFVPLLIAEVFMTWYPSVKNSNA